MVGKKGFNEHTSELSLYELGNVHKTKTTGTSLKGFAEGLNTDLPVLDRAESHAVLSLRTLWSYRKVIGFCLVISLNGFLFGYDTGVIGGFFNMHSFKRTFSGVHELQTYQTGLMVSAYHLGCIAGGFTLARLAESLGRKLPISISMLVYIIGDVIQITSVKTGKWWQFAVGRAVSGLCIGSVAVLAPMFISETAPTLIRGSCTFLYQLMVCFAILIGNIINYICKEQYPESQLSWIVPLIFGSSMAVALALGIATVPESARYLISMGRVSLARRSLLRTDHSGDVDTTIEALKMRLTIDSNASKVGFLAMFQKQYLKRVLVGVLLMLFQQMSGVDYFLYYGTTLFKSIGLQDSYVTSMILTTVNLVVSFMGIYLIEKFGRKKCLVLGGVGCFVSLFMYSIIGTLLIRPDADNKTPGVIMIVFTCLFFVSFSPTWAACVGVLVSELYPIHIKAKAIAFGTAFNWGANFFIGFCTPIITAQIGYKYGFVFTGFMFCAVWFVVLMVPETQGISLEEIENLF